MPMRRTRGLARTMGRTAVIAGTATAVSGHVAAKQQAKYAQQAVAPTEQASPPAEQPAPPAEPVDVVEQLKKFAELRDQGILTEDEFAGQKAKLLAT
jgi:Short C-terminal domain